MFALRSITPSKCHSSIAESFTSFRIDDYYTKIKVDKLFSIYNQEMIDSSINEALKQQLFKMVIQVLQYVSQHHLRILSCEMEWVRVEQTGLIYLSDIRNMKVSRQGNKPFTNSLYRHMKRNLVVILDNDKKELHERRLQD